jgi:hypothetical protein
MPPHARPARSLDNEIVRSPEPLESHMSEPNGVEDHEGDQIPAENPAAISDPPASATWDSPIENGSQVRVCKTAVNTPTTM